MLIEPEKGPSDVQEDCDEGKRELRHHYSADHLATLAYVISRSMQPVPNQFSSKEVATNSATLN